MRKLLPVLFLLSILHTGVRAQYTVKWCDTTGIVLPHDMAIDASGIIGLNGQVYESGFYGNSAVSALDTSGSPLWLKNYGHDPIFPREIMVNPYHQFIAAGEYENSFGTATIYLNAYNLSGDSLSGGIQQSAGFNHDDEFAHAVMDSRGIVYVGGGSTAVGSLSASLTRFDTGCVNRWNDTLEGSFTSYTVGTVIVGDTAVYNLVATLHTYGYFGLSRSDTNGNLIWFRDSLGYSNTNYHTCFTADKDGNLLFGGGPATGFALMKMNPDGDSVWSRSLSYPGLTAASGVVNTVLTDDDNNIYAFGDHSAGLPYYFLIAKYSPAGALIWQDTIQEDFSYHAGKNHEHVLLQNGRITVIQGTASSRIYQYSLDGVRLMDTALILNDNVHSLEVEAMEFFNGDLYIAGINQNGPLYNYTPFVARLGMPGTTAVAAVTAGVPLLYPNPAGNILYIPGSGTQQMYVTDASGKTSAIARMANDALDLSRLAPGLYFLSTKEKDGAVVYRGRFLKE